MSQQQNQHNNGQFQPDQLADLTPHQVYAKGKQHIGITGGMATINDNNMTNQLLNPPHHHYPNMAVLSGLPAHPPVGGVAPAACQPIQHDGMRFMWHQRGVGPGVANASLHPGSFPPTIQGNTPNNPPPAASLISSSMSERASKGATNDKKKAAGGKTKTAAKGGKGKGGSGKASKGAEESSTSDTTKESHSRERNREHARSTRLRKKAYIQKLKDMAQGLRAVQTEEIRQRRISMQKLVDSQKIRRSVVRTVLQYHAQYEKDTAKWDALVEDSFWMKQPVTPFRSFRKSEVERDCRVIRGANAIVCDAASLRVMVERIGCHTARWKRIKRNDFVQEDFLNKEITVCYPPESSLSSGSSTDSSSGPCSSSRKAKATKRKATALDEIPDKNAESTEPKKVSSASESGDRLPAASASENEETYSKMTFANLQSQRGARPNDTEDTASSKRMKFNTNQQNALSHSNKSSPAHVAASMGSVSQSSVAAGLGLRKTERTSAYYCINEDDMIMIEDLLMCPFVFRTRNAISCGALTDCVMPGMLRAQFSNTNKLLSMELVFDAMGLMQQLDSANGGKVTAQVIPGSLEMALMPCPLEARVITEANPPYNILHVNEAWTKLTHYSQLEVEGNHLLPLLEGACLENSVGVVVPERSGHSLEDVTRGRAACSTSVHYNKLGEPFVDFVCSYPLTSEADEITHLLHVSMELPQQGYVA